MKTSSLLHYHPHNQSRHELPKLIHTLFEEETIQRELDNQKRFVELWCIQNRLRLVNSNSSDHHVDDKEDQGELPSMQQMNLYVDRIRQFLRTPKSLFLNGVKKLRVYVRVIVRALKSSCYKRQMCVRKFVRRWSTAETILRNELKADIEKKLERQMKYKRNTISMTHEDTKRLLRVQIDNESKFYIVNEMYLEQFRTKFVPAWRSTRIKSPALKFIFYVDTATLLSDAVWERVQTYEQTKSMKEFEKMTASGMITVPLDAPTQRRVTLVNAMLAQQLDTTKHKRWFDKYDDEDVLLLRRMMQKPSKDVEWQAKVLKRKQKPKATLEDIRCVIHSSPSTTTSSTALVVRDEPEPSPSEGVTMTIAEVQQRIQEQEDCETRKYVRGSMRVSHTCVPFLPPERPPYQPKHAPRPRHKAIPYDMTTEEYGMYLLKKLRRPIPGLHPPKTDVKKVK